MNPTEFVAKWKRNELRERQFSHSHFNDVCALVGHPTPIEEDPKGEWFCFDVGAKKPDKSDGFADVWKRGYFAWEYKGKHKNLDEAYAQLDGYSAALDNPPLLVVCDPERFLIHTNFTNTKHVVHEVTLSDLLLPERLEILRAVFFDPEKLRPGRVNRLITAGAARSLGELAQVLRDRGLDPRKVARFLDRLIFAMFAEDIALLPQGLVSQLLDMARQHPERFQRMTETLFGAMAQGGEFGVHPIRHFNGNLYDDAEALALQRKEIEILYQAARLDWTAIDPSIFGTLFERGLDPSKRSQIGAHYTSREDIETLVEPVIMTPLRREWNEARATAESLLRTGHKNPAAEAPAKELSGAALAKARREAGLLVERFLDRLERVTILDPACGSGNFLYVALQRLLDLEHQVRRFAIDHNFPTLLRVGVGPWQLYGIEINDYVAELAQMTVWIGYLQWLHNHGTSKWKEPILTAMSNIECRDAILEFSDDGSPQEPAWPSSPW